MKLIIPKDLLTFIDSVKEHLSRPVYIIKCIAYIKIKHITLEEIETTISANYESTKNDRTNKFKLEGED